MERPLLPAQLEVIIREITQDLLEMVVSPHVRELKAKAVTYGRVVGNWATYAPTPPQVQAMSECVIELQGKVGDAKREGNRDVSRVTRRQAGEPSQPSNGAHAPHASSQATPHAAQPHTARSAKPPVPFTSSIPPALAWNASVPEASGVRARKSAATSESPTRPPPGISGHPEASPSIPPLLAPRHIETPTPVPALLRSRRSR